MSKFTVGCNFNGCVWMNDAETRKQADRLSTQHMEHCQGHEVYILDNVKARETARKSLGRRLCAFCGEAYPEGTPETKHSELTAHIWECKKHPMAELKELLMHCWIYDGYEKCGYNHMTTEQKVVFDKVIIELSSAN